MNPRLLLGVILALGIGLAAWALWSSSERPAVQQPGSGRSDYVLRDFELIMLDDTGSESFTLRAPLLQETPGAKTIDVQTPLFLLPDESGQPWHVRSRTAWVSADQNEIRLRGAVTADSPHGAGDPVRMQTEELNVFPDTRKATSEVAVLITQPGLTMRGTGLQADMARRQATLLSEVHTTYARHR